MESQMVRRRFNVIAAHLASNEDLSATATHVFPMRCSNSLNSVIRRCDNRMNFARQGSSYQGCYMRQASPNEQAKMNSDSCSESPNTVIRRCDNRLNFARQGSSYQGFFMRQASNEQANYIQPAAPVKSTTCLNKGSNDFAGPTFSRPADVECGIPTVKEIQSVVQGCTYSDTCPEAPVFSRPSEMRVQPQIESEKKTCNSVSTGSQWSPRMDVVDSGFNYFVTLEIPGVSIDSIKVEVNGRSLIVTGNRSSWSCGPDKSATCYSRREILQGPYQIEWPLPANANKENVSAEMQDGLLRITIPKLSGLRWLRKSYM